MWGKSINHTARTRSCDLCGKCIPQGSAAHYVVGRANGEYVAGWQHAACWERFFTTGISEKAAAPALQIAKLLEKKPTAPLQKRDDVCVERGEL